MVDAHLKRQLNFFKPGSKRDTIAVLLRCLEAGKRQGMFFAYLNWLLHEKVLQNIVCSPSTTMMFSGLTSGWTILQEL